MAYAFKTTRNVAQQIRSIALDQAEKAVNKARSGDGNFDETVHELRRRCKKLRGLLRLIEPHFKAFDDENDAIRDAADLLGGARDAQVMVETLDDLVAGRKAHTAAEQAIGARVFLVERVERLMQADDRQQVLDQFAMLMEKIARRASHWDFDDRGYVLIGDGLERTFKQFCKRLAHAATEESAEAMHEWRKHAKYHGHHVSLLEKSAPDMLGPRGKTLAKLGDLLGDHHNLAVLEQTLDDWQGETGKVREALTRRQDKLADAAIGLGRQLAAEKPSALRLRFAGYWDLLPKEG